MSTPARRAATCGPWLTPPWMTATRRPMAWAMGAVVAATWAASSRVGTRTRARGKLGRRVCGRRRQGDDGGHREGDGLAAAGAGPAEHVTAGERAGQGGGLDGERRRAAGLDQGGDDRRRARRAPRRWCRPAGCRRPRSRTPGRSAGRRTAGGVGGGLAGRPRRRGARADGLVGMKGVPFDSESWPLMLRPHAPKNGNPALANAHCTRPRRRRLASLAAQLYRTGLLRLVPTGRAGGRAVRASNWRR